MSTTEQRSIAVLGSLLFIRVLGLAMILPVFTLYAHYLIGTTPKLIGLALGIYGFTQACLQLPFGLLSDRIGRKPVILMGLSMLAIGSLIAAYSTHIYGVIIGRALQGAGAIGSTLLALVADLTLPEHRSQAMAMLGASIGVSFTLAMLIGPVLNQLIGVPGIFGATTAFAIVGILILYYGVPSPKHLKPQLELQTLPASLKAALGDKQLLILDFGIFTLHFILIASFIVLPVMLQNLLQSQMLALWVYFPLLTLAFLSMLPMIIMAERWAKSKQLLVMAIGLLILSLFILWESHNILPLLIFGMYLFFVAFNILEASLPSIISKLVSPTRKGTAMGVYSTAQFLGIFAGGVVGGRFYASSHLADIFLFLMVLAGIWFAFTFNMRPIKALKQHLFTLSEHATTHLEETRNALLALQGVEQVAFDAHEPLAYLTVDKFEFKTETLEKLSEYFDKSLKT